MSWHRGIKRRNYEDKFCGVPYSGLPFMCCCCFGFCLLIAGITLTVEGANLTYHNNLIESSTRTNCTISVLERGEVCDKGSTGSEQNNRKVDYAGTEAFSPFCGNDTALRFHNARGVCYYHDPFQEEENVACWVNCGEEHFYITGKFSQAGTFLALGLSFLFTPFLCCLCCCICSGCPVDSNYNEREQGKIEKRWRARAMKEGATADVYPMTLEDLQGQWRNDDGIGILVTDLTVTTSLSGRQYKLEEHWNRFELFMGDEEWILRKDADKIVWKNGIRGEWDTKITWERDSAPPVYRDALRDNVAGALPPAASAPPLPQEASAPPSYDDSGGPPGYNDATNEGPPGYNEINMTRV